MRGRTTSLPVNLPAEERGRLEQPLRGTTTSPGLARRCRAILGLADGLPLIEVARLVDLTEKHVRQSVQRFLTDRLDGWHDRPGRGRKPVVPPAVAMHVVRIACERPDDAGRSLSQWDGTEIARRWVRDGVVASIAAETVRRIRLHHRLEAWRQKMGPSAQVPRDAAFAEPVQGSGDLSTRPLRPDAVVRGIDEMTRLRPRKSKTLATEKDRPTRVEHGYGRCGALDPFAAFDTRSGKVDGSTASRKGQVELIASLERLDRELPASARTVHVVLDDVRMPKGKQVQAWLAKPPRFVVHHPPVPCSWRNRVEQWFGILKRERLRIADVPDKERLAERVMAFLGEWDEIAHPFHGTSKSVAKVMAKCQVEDAKPLAGAA